MPFRGRKVIRSPEKGGILTPHSLCVLQGRYCPTVYYDLRVESSGWLFKSPLAGGEGHSVLAPLQAAQLVVAVL